MPPECPALGWGGSREAHASSPPQVSPCSPLPGQFSSPGGLVSSQDTDMQGLGASKVNGVYVGDCGWLGWHQSLSLGPHTACRNGEGQQSWWKEWSEEGRRE